MAKKTAKKRVCKDDIAETLRTMLIVQLRLAGVDRGRIRAIVGCDMHRVAGVLKHLKDMRNAGE